MSEVIKVLSAREVAAPRGALWAADALVWLMRALGSRPRPPASASHGAAQTPV